MDIINEVLRERERQDAKWGVQNVELPIWLTILGEEFGEVCEAVLKEIFSANDHIEEVKTELVQVAAVAVAILEYIERVEHES
jgi:NTP pyrophosphatase (non-canonical NTP hydrolase)